MTEGKVSMSYPEWCRRQVRVDGKVIQLTSQEHKLVVTLLAHHPEHWVHYPDLVESLWGGCRMPDAWVDGIQAAAYTLRQKGVPVHGRVGHPGGNLRIYTRGRSE